MDSVNHLDSELIFLIQYLHLGHWGSLWQFGIYEAEEEEAQRTQEQSKDLEEEVKVSLLKE